MELHQSPVQALSRNDLALAAGGPALIGAVLGMHAHAGPDTWIMLRTAVALPAVLLGVAAAMLPALYIATSLAGMAPPARAVAAALGRALRAAGLVSCGLAAPTLFLLATSRIQPLVVVLGGAAVAAAALAGLRVLFADLFARPARPGAPLDGTYLLVRAVFTVWSLVSLAIGMRMYLEHVIG